MPRRKVPGLAPRTFRVDLESYNEILDFFDASPSGICGADAIREIVKIFGNYCREQRRQGVVASGKHLEAIEGLVLDLMEEAKDGSS